VLQQSCITGGDADAASVAAGLPGAAGLVPGFPADLVEGLGGPLDHVERIGALHRGRAAFGHHLGDPVGLIGENVADQHATFGTELVEEAAQRGPVPARRGPHQPPRIVINDDGDEPMPALVGNLVDPDPGQPVGAVTELLDVGPDPADDRPDGAPGDAHQRGDRALRRLGGQRCHGLVEGERVPGAVPRPRHVRDHDTVLAAGHPGSVGF
jgi:hypothetical protein